jgi:hypothetical protein
MTDEGDRLSFLNQSKLKGSPSAISASRQPIAIARVFHFSTELPRRSELRPQASILRFGWQG